MLHVHLLHCDSTMAIVTDADSSPAELLVMKERERDYICSSHLRLIRCLTLWGP
jgi:hypothetical protein